MNLSEETWLVAGQQQPEAGNTSVWLSHLATYFRGRIASWVERYRRMQDARILHGFSDRELRDLSLSRSDIMGIENGSFRRD